MGKKNRGRNGPTLVGTRKEQAAVNKQNEIVNLVTELLEKCSKPAPGNGVVDWNEYLALHDIIQRIIALQKDDTQRLTTRRRYFDEFLEWAIDGGVDVEAVQIAEDEYGQYGLRAKKDIEKDSLFLRIPRKLMMTTATAMESNLGTLAQHDQLLCVMPNVLLALHLLGEKSKRDSFWKPYIRILPPAFNTVLYFTPDDMMRLKGSPALYDAVLLYRNIARHYAYFHKLFRVFPATKDTFLTGEFCYEDYRWAVSAVMTRQNTIPHPDTSRPYMNALIPLWDMANHCNGVITTDFSAEQDCSECFALQNFKEGEEIRIFYGTRANAEFLVHSGFVYPENQHDYLAIKLGISKSDPFATYKTAILSKFNIASSQYFPLYAGEYVVHSELLVFLRVFSMNESELKSYLASVGDGDKVRLLLDIEHQVSKDNETKAWSFLETRTKLLLKAYPTTLEDDMARLDNPETGAHSRIATQLQICEKRILLNACEFAERRKQELIEVVEPGVVDGTVPEVQSQLD